MYQYIQISIYIQCISLSYTVVPYSLAKPHVYHRENEGTEICIFLIFLLVMSQACGPLQICFCFVILLIRCQTLIDFFSLLICCHMSIEFFLFIFCHKEQNLLQRLFLCLQWILYNQNPQCPKKMYPNYAYLCYLYFTILLIFTLRYSVYFCSMFNQPINLQILT